jgi:hypothetical protein
MMDASYRCDEILPLFRTDAVEAPRALSSAGRILGLALSCPLEGDLFQSTPFFLHRHPRVAFGVACGHGGRTDL